MKVYLVRRESEDRYVGDDYVDAIFTMLESAVAFALNNYKEYELKDVYIEEWELNKKDGKIDIVWEGRKFVKRYEKEEKKKEGDFTSIDDIKKLYKSLAEWNPGVFARASTAEWLKAFRGDPTSTIGGGEEDE